jgi:hypothetical protein
MSWKCPECGTEIPDIAGNGCDACGYIRYGTLILASEASGKELQIRIDTSVTGYLLKGLAGEDSRYASVDQFRVYRDSAIKSWAVRHTPEAKNPTCLNGKPLESVAAPLKEGDVLSIGPERLRLKIKIVGG